MLVGSPRWLIGLSIGIGAPLGRGGGISVGEGNNGLVSVFTLTTEVHQLGNKLVGEGTAAMPVGLRATDL